MTRYELIRMLVLNEISDDYEEPQHIYERLAALGCQPGLAIEPREVSRALIDAVELGWAKAYDLSRDPAQETPVSQVVDRANDYYYWITPRGREVQSAFNGWPFDDNGEPLPGWSPPAV
jgi:hypothetical protein